MRDPLGAPYADAQSVMTLIYDYSGSGDLVGGVYILTVMLGHGVWVDWAIQRDTHYAARRCLIITRCLSIMIFPNGFPSLMYLEPSHSKLNDLVDAGWLQHFNLPSRAEPQHVQIASPPPKLKRSPPLQIAVDSLPTSSLSSSLYCFHSLQYGFHH